MAGILLDTHTLLWLDAEQPLRLSTLFAIAEAEKRNSLYVSPISAWEIGVAGLKKNESGRPHLRGLTPAVWFQQAVTRTGAKVLNLTQRICMEAAEVPKIYGSGDPGDCFLIATTRIRKISLATRDARIIALAKNDPGYLKVIEC